MYTFLSEWKANWVLLDLVSFHHIKAYWLVIKYKYISIYEAKFGQTNLQYIIDGEVIELFIAQK